MASKQIAATWQKLATADTLQRSSQVIAVVDDRCYIFGGELEARVPRDNDVFQVDIAEDTHSPATVSKLDIVSPAPQARVGSALTVLHGKLYLFSGRGGIAMKPIDEQGAFWVFDPALRSWAQLGPENPQLDHPEARSYHAVTNDGVDTIFIHAGCPEAGRLADLWKFEVSLRRWTKLASAPDPPRGGTSIAYTQGLLYRMNGFDGKKEQGGAIDVYDPKLNEWTTQFFTYASRSGPEARSVSVLVPLLINSKPHVVTCFGERDPSALGHAGAGKMLNDVWAFNLSNQFWTPVHAKSTLPEDSPSPRGWFAAEATNKGILIQGGLGEDNNRFDDMWLLHFE